LHHHKRTKADKAADRGVRTRRSLAGTLAALPLPPQRLLAVLAVEALWQRRHQGWTTPAEYIEARREKPDVAARGGNESADRIHQDMVRREFRELVRRLPKGTVQRSKPLRRPKYRLPLPLHRDVTVWLRTSGRAHIDSSLWQAYRSAHERPAALSDNPVAHVKDIADRVQEVFSSHLAASPLAVYKQIVKGLPTPTPCTLEYAPALLRACHYLLITADPSPLAYAATLLKALCEGLSGPHDPHEAAELVRARLDLIRVLYELHIHRVDAPDIFERIETYVAALRETDTILAHRDAHLVANAAELEAALALSEGASWGSHNPDERHKSLQCAEAALERAVRFYRLAGDPEGMARAAYLTAELNYFGACMDREPRSPNDYLGATLSYIMYTESARKAGVRGHTGFARARIAELLGKWAVYDALGRKAKREASSKMQQAARWLDSGAVEPRPLEKEVLLGTYKALRQMAHRAKIPPPHCPSALRESKKGAT
jgi:hypothetical protein